MHGQPPPKNSFPYRRTWVATMKTTQGLYNASGSRNQSTSTYQPANVVSWVLGKTPQYTKHLDSSPPEATAAAPL
jgi:hypothetical protein